MHRVKIIVLLLSSVLVMSACGGTIDVPSITDFTNSQAAQPTPQRTATLPPSLRTLLPADMTATANAPLFAPQGVQTATPDPNATAIVLAQPTPILPVATEMISAEPTPLPPTPTATPIPTAEPLEISLRTPLQNSQFIAGTGIDVSGSARGIVAGQLIRVTLANAQGGQITAVTLIAESGDWRVIMPVPDEITGALFVQAKIVTPAGDVLTEAAVPIEVIDNITLSEIPEDDYFISLDRLSTQAVAGKGIFLNGRSGSPLAIYDVTIEIYYQNCTVGAGPISFQMYGSGAWNGYLIVPGGTQGDTICVRAYTGTPGSDSYRQAEKSFVVLDALDPAARSVQIAVPRPGSYYTAPFEITGTAINPPLGYVLVQVLTADGAVLWEDTTIPDGFGNWRIMADFTVQSPFSVSLVAILDNADGTFITDKHAINVQPLGTGDG
ncbi:MAG TPA: hypothetical protein ENJ56_01045 [Anaerolineae bacterium]|nr:hypothetical protein [Anaerolineae bacterium]